MQIKVGDWIIIIEDALNNRNIEEIKKIDFDDLIKNHLCEDFSFDIELKPGNIHLIEPAVDLREKTIEFNTLFECWFCELKKDKETYNLENCHNCPSFKEE